MPAILLAGAAIAIFLAISLPTPAQTIVDVLTADAQVGADGGINATDTTASIGNRSNKPRYVAVLPLPALPANHRFAQASFRIVAQNYNSYDQNANLHGLPYRTAAAVQAADYAAAGTVLQEAFFHPGMSSGWNPIYTSEEGTTALTAYLNAQHAAAAADRAAGESIYLFLRISPVSHGGGTYRYYQVYTAENEGWYRPRLTYVAAPVPPPAAAVWILR